MTEQNYKQQGTTIWGLAAQTHKIGTIKTYEKGLMQQLFPALEEVER
jgi:hypothetical protein